MTSMFETCQHRACARRAGPGSLARAKPPGDPCRPREAQQAAWGDGLPPLGLPWSGGRLGRGVPRGETKAGGERHVPVHCPGRLFSFCPGGRGSRRRSRRRQSPPASCCATARVALLLALVSREAKRRGQAPTVTDVTGVASPRRRPLTVHRPDGLLGPVLLLMSASRRAVPVHSLPPGPFPSARLFAWLLALLRLGLLGLRWWQGFDGAVDDLRLRKGP